VSVTTASAHVDRHVVITLIDRRVAIRPIERPVAIRQILGL
jgi:hypothetical protein